jgi:hypothetical protein
MYSRLCAVELLKAGITGGVARWAHVQPCAKKDVPLDITRTA